ncbi:hypothetical protein BYT27DRAFT_7210247 [Phlegmacium glaucopus]|nr:hypothetical protein BYT27DRAFT_7210247 [Phlegmacium glaucopus]
MLLKGFFDEILSIPVGWRPEFRQIHPWTKDWSIISTLKSDQYTHKLSNIWSNIGWQQLSSSSWYQSQEPLVYPLLMEDSNKDTRRAEISKVGWTMEWEDIHVRHCWVKKLAMTIKICGVLEERLSGSLAEGARKALQMSLTFDRWRFADKCPVGTFDIIEGPCIRCGLTTVYMVEVALNRYVGPSSKEREIEHIAQPGMVIREENGKVDKGHLQGGN